jgi:hypothetical protein
VVEKQEPASTGAGQSGSNCRNPDYIQRIRGRGRVQFGQEGLRSPSEELGSVCGRKAPEASEEGSLGDRILG